MKIVFMGTPDFAAASLEAILNAGYEVTAVVTQPDKPQGRSDKLIPSPVKRVALEHGLAVLQPERIKRPEEIEKLRQFPADLYVVAAFGQILSKEILDMPRLGCVNIHASLLPKYRGAAPIQWAILNGDDVTGVTIMRMDVGLDTGDMIMKKARRCRNAGHNRERGRGISASSADPRAFRRRGSRRPSRGKRCRTSCSGRSCRR